MHDLGFHNNVSLSVRLKGPMVTLLQLQKIVYDGFRAAMEHHLALFVTLDGLNSKPAMFSCLSDVDMSGCISFVQLTSQDLDDPAQIDEFLSKQNSTGFTRSDLPVWRAIVHYCLDEKLVTKLRLSLVWHHVIADGRSGLAALSSILKGVDFAVDQSVSAPQAMTVPDSIARCSTQLLHRGLPLDLETAIHDSPVSNDPSHVTIPSMDVRPEHLQSQGTKWSGSNFTLTDPIITRVKQISLPANITQSVAGACHQRGVTITPLIQAIAAKLIFEAVTGAGWLRSAVAIDLRPFADPHLGITARDMGFWVTAFHVEMARSEFEQEKEGLWQRVERSAAIFRHWVSQGRGDVDLKAISRVKDFEHALMEQVGRERMNSFGVTNLGVCDVKGSPGHDSFESSAFDVLDILFSQSAHVTGSAVQFCIATAKNGPMSIALTWQDELLEGAMVTEIAMRMKEILCSLGGGEGNQAR